MDQLPPYDFQKYVFATRCAVLVCSSFELLMLLLGSLPDSNMLAKLLYFVFLSASTAISAHNIALNIDGREEIKRLLKVEVRGSQTELEIRAKSTALVLGPVISGIFVFLGVSGHAFFSLFVLVHVVAAVGQLAMEVYEQTNQTGFSAGAPDTPPSTQLRATPAPVTPNPDPLASPIVPPADKTARAGTYDPNYQTLNNIHNDIFDKKQ